MTHYGFNAKENNSKIDVNLRAYLPLFTFGVIFSDVENLKLPKGELMPFEKMRQLAWYWKIPINLVLVILFTFYGSTIEQETCKKRGDDCAFFDAVQFYQGAKFFWIFQTIAAIAGFILAITSQWFQWILETLPFWFLGKVSYTLYLVHLLVIQWCQAEVQQAFINAGHDYDLAVLYVFLIFTPVLLLVSWVLEILFDTPGKNLAHALDVWMRVEDPTKKKKADVEAGQEEEEEDERTCGKFLTEQWFVWVLLGYLIVVLFVTESYGAVDDNEARIRGDAKASEGMTAKS